MPQTDLESSFQAEIPETNPFYGGDRTESITAERAILAGLIPPSRWDQEEPLEELEGLAEAAGTIVVASLFQKRNHPDPATCLGQGKLDELKMLVEQHNADVVIFDNDLLPGQTRNLEQTINVKVIDRTELILDIFAARAKTSQARLAVELAQLEYSLPRLKRMWTHLSRQTKGGVGLRGPGEKQLEVDKRLAQKRITDLKRELKTIHQRKQREVSGRSEERTICLVGYTNVGKSTLINALTSADVFVKDQLFATLDTRTRRWQIPGWGRALISDTVGFIRDLPHHLVASFRSTLEEAIQADLLIHVADGSNPNVFEQIASANNVLRSLGIDEKRTILVINKSDNFAPWDNQGNINLTTSLQNGIDNEDLSDLGRYHRLKDIYPHAVFISANKKWGFDKLTAAVIDALGQNHVHVEISFPASDGKLLSELSERSEVLNRRFDESGMVWFECRIEKGILDSLTKKHCDNAVTVRNFPDNVVYN